MSNTENTNKCTINVPSFDKITIEKNSKGLYDITLEATHTREYFQGYNKVTDTYTTKSGFWADEIENIVIHPVRFED